MEVADRAREAKSSPSPVRAPDRLTRANALRALAMDAVEQARSGHPGMPMGMADIAEVLWNDYLVHNPGNPQWLNRDRFVLSNGHGSMLLYAVLHLTGYDLSIDEIKRFRQLGSKTPGHPEVGCTPGVETTTGPLGQGIANAVGMALAERALARRFNRPGFDIIDHHTYVFAGDGCLMEGISHEACSFAGTQRLGKLIVVYDDNGISIDGRVTGWFTEDVAARFGAYGWHVVAGVDGHDPQSIRAAIDEARIRTDRPSLICCKTVIGWGAPNKQGDTSVHGAPLGAEEVAWTRENIEWPFAAFEIPPAIRQAWDARPAGEAAETRWQSTFDRYRRAHPELAAELVRRTMGALPMGWPDAARALVADADARTASVATRKASQQALESLARSLPELIGGSADLTGSNLTRWSDAEPITADRPDGSYIHFGAREFAMAAIANGIALHGGFIPYSGTFLMFSEYARNALRMAALMGVRSIFVFTHDSIGLGEDGPTHQAVEQAATLRLMPNCSVWRPCDAVETAVAWRAAIERRDGPTCLLLTRQSVPHQPRTEAQRNAIAKGGYVLRDCEGTPDVIVIATGSEVQPALEGAERAARGGVRVRVVSMPSADRFERQDAEYRESVLPSRVRARLAVEAGVSDWWRKYVGLDGAVVGIDRFGESAPAAALFEHFALTGEAVAGAISSLAAALHEGGAMNEHGESPCH